MRVFVTVGMTFIRKACICKNYLETFFFLLLLWHIDSALDLKHSTTRIACSNPANGMDTRLTSLLCVVPVAASETI